MTFGVCMYLYWQRDAARRYSGLIVGWFFVLVFGFRFLVEGIKNVQERWEYDLIAQWGVNMGQLLSIPFILAGLALIVYAYRHPIADQAK